MSFPGPGISPQGIGIGADTLSVVDTTTATSGTTITRSSLSIGADVPSRLIIVAIAWGAISSRSISSVTIGGVTATAATDSGLHTTGVAIYYAQCSGTSISVVTTFSSGIAAFSQTVYRATIVSATPVDANNISNSLNPTTVADIEVQNGGILIICGYAQGTGVTLSPTYNGSDTIADDQNGQVNSSQYAEGSCLTTQSVTTNDPGYTTGTTAIKRVAAASWR
jgi:hypothetical protein